MYVTFNIFHGYFSNYLDFTGTYVNHVYFGGNDVPCENKCLNVLSMSTVLTQQVDASLYKPEMAGKTLYVVALAFALIMANFVIPLVFCPSVHLLVKFLRREQLAVSTSTRRMGLPPRYSQCRSPPKTKRTVRPSHHSSSLQ